MDLLDSILFLCKLRILEGDFRGWGLWNFQKGDFNFFMLKLACILECPRGGPLIFFFSILCKLLILEGFGWWGFWTLHEGDF